MLKVEIDRRTWGRGSEMNWVKYGTAMLYNKNLELYCCLGFVCKAAGLDDDDIESVDMP